MDYGHTHQLNELAWKYATNPAKLLKKARLDEEKS